MASKKLKRLDLVFKDENDTEQLLKKTFARPVSDIINDLISSGLKGRGGAGFPTGLKWKLTADAKSPAGYESRSAKYVIRNAASG